MTKRCDYLISKTLDCVVCEATVDQCPRKRNRRIVNQSCWQVKKNV